MTCNKFTNLGAQISLKQRINCQALDGFYTCTASYCMKISGKQLQFYKENPNLTTL